MREERPIPRSSWALSAAIAFAIFSVAFSFHSSVLWPFLPLSFAILSLWLRALGLWALGLSFSFHFFVIVSDLSDIQVFQTMALGLFHLMGLFLIKFQKSFLPWPRLIFFMLGFLLVLFSVYVFQQGFEGVEARLEAVKELPSSPGIFDQSRWEEANESLYRQLVAPVARSASVAILSLHFMYWFLYSALIWQVVLALGSRQIFARRRFWLELGHWRLTEWILVPLALSLALLLWQMPRLLVDSFDIWVMIAWNLLFISAFLIMMRGLAIAAYLMPRISPFALILLLLGLVFAAPLILIIAGFGDIWFDFRKRIRSNPFSGREPEDQD
ncbi:MAG: hypothetical protein EA369_06105 [Bradymonadales bacterium]|nr:MAG: hypothetical protein EA369_06105 [Bradymonadales bacterium]